METDTKSEKNKEEKEQKGAMEVNMCEIKNVLKLRVYTTRIHIQFATLNKVSSNDILQVRGGHVFKSKQGTVKEEFWISELDKLLEELNALFNKNIIESSI